MYLFKFISIFFTTSIYLMIIPEGDFSGKEIVYWTNPSNSVILPVINNRTTDQTQVEVLFYYKYQPILFPRWNLASPNANRSVQKEVCVLVHGGTETDDTYIDCVVSHHPYTDRTDSFHILFRHFPRPRGARWKGAWAADLLGCNCSEASKMSRSYAKLTLLVPRRHFLITKAPTNGFFKADAYASKEKSRAYLTECVWLKYPVPHRYDLFDIE